MKLNMEIPIRRITLGEDKGIKITKNQDGIECEERLSKEDEDRIMIYRALFLIIKFLKHNQKTGVVLTFRPWLESYVRIPLDDLASIGSGVISIKELEDKEESVTGYSGVQKTIRSKQVLIKLSTSLERKKW